MIELRGEWPTQTVPGNETREPCPISFGTIFAQVSIRGRIELVLLPEHDETEQIADFVVAEFVEHAVGHKGLAGVL